MPARQTAIMDSIPTADQNVIPLSPFDNTMVRIYLFTLYILETPAGCDIRRIHAQFEMALAHTIEDLPFLGGKLYLDSKGRLEIRLPTSKDIGAPTRVNFSDLREELNLEDLLDAGIPDDDLDGTILNAASLFADLEHGSDVVVCQANFIEGGCILSFAVHHSVCDGAGQTTVMKTLANHMQRLDASRLSNLPRHLPNPLASDKGVLSRLWKDAGNTPWPRACEEASEDLWRFLGVNNIAKSTSSSLAGEAPATNEPMATSIFYISKDDFAAMKKEASGGQVNPDDLGKQITANDALMAFLWQAIMRARFPPETLEPADNTESMLDSTFDGRGKFSSELPPDYTGNVVLISTARMALRDLVDRGASIAAPSRKVRQALNGIDTRRIHDAFALADSLPGYTNITFPFATFAGCELCITSLINFPAYDLQFGASFANEGRAVSFRPPKSEFAAICRRCMILPKRQEGGFEVLIAMFASEMNRLMEDVSFSRWAKRSS